MLPPHSGLCTILRFEFPGSGPPVRRPGFCLECEPVAEWPDRQALRRVRGGRKAPLWAVGRREGILTGGNNAPGAARRLPTANSITLDFRLAGGEGMEYRLSYKKTNRPPKGETKA
jgi:hypothetical protein